MKYNFTDEQKRHIISIVLSAFVSLVVALGVALGYPVTVTPGAQGEIGVQGLSQIRFSNPVVFQRTATFNQATTQTGALTVAGLVNADGGIAVDTSAFTVADTSGNTAIAGTLTVGGGYGTTGCTVSAAGAVSCNGALIVGNTATFTDTLNMSNAAITNVGAAGTDFSATGGLTLADALVVTSGGINVSNGAISNIGAAGTDFTSSGGLTLADVLTVNSTAVITGALNMSNAAINNVGASGTDFSATGGLTLADALVVSSGGINVSNAVISNIGNASTDFDLSGGLTVAGGITGTVNTAAQASITQVGTLVTTTVGTGGVGSFTAHAPAIFTDTVTFVAASIADAALSANVPLLNAANAFTAAQTVVTTTVGSGGVGSLTAHAPVVMTDTLNVTGLTTLGTATATTLQIGGVAFSGAMKYGTSATYVEGTSITHGFATTPTVCLLTPMPITGTLTITTTGFSSDTGMAAVPIYWMCGQ